MFEVNVERGRTVAFTVALYRADGTTEETLAAGDVVRFKVGRRNSATPLLDLDSDTHTSNLSFTAGTNDVNVTFLQTDTASLEPGAYEAEVALVDASDSDRIKTAEQGVVHLISSMGGSVVNP